MNLKIFWERALWELKVYKHNKEHRNILGALYYGDHKKLLSMTGHLKTYNKLYL